MTTPESRPTSELFGTPHKREAVPLPEGGAGAAAARKDEKDELERRKGADRTACEERIIKQQEIIARLKTQVEGKAPGKTQEEPGSKLDRVATKLDEYVEHPSKLKPALKKIGQGALTGGLMVAAGVGTVLLYPLRWTANLTDWILGKAEGYCFSKLPEFIQKLAKGKGEEKHEGKKEEAHEKAHVAAHPAKHEEPGKKGGGHGQAKKH